MSKRTQKRTIFVEGKTDVLFLRYLGISKKRISRSGDRGKVCNDVRNSICVIGLVDEDPNQKPSEYFREHTI